jgi:hypothetical protein
MQSNENRLRAQAICDEVKEKVGDYGPGTWQESMLLIKMLVDDQMPGNFV